MHYGHKPHTPSPDDLLLLHCRNCGWTSEELTKEQVKALGMPYACHGTCGRHGAEYVRFHPSERAQARAIFGLE